MSELHLFAILIGQIYKVIQPHTTQSGWEPSKTPALWSLA